MSEWWTYRPQDFLMFAPETYWRLFERHNAATWPLPLLLPPLAALWLLWWWRRPEGAAWRVGLAAQALALALALAAVAWCFVWRLYEPINWAAAGFALLLAGLAAALLALLAMTLLRRPGPGSRPRHVQAPRRAAGALLLGLAVGVYPLLAVAAGRPWSQAEVIGLAPDPTVMALLGLLLGLRATGGAERLLLALLWIGAVASCAVGSATLWTMGSALGAVPAAAAGFALLVLLWTHWHAQPATEPRR